MEEDLSRGVREEIDRAKKNLDQLADALDRVASDPELRAKLAVQPMETLLGMGFDLDEETKKEIMQQLSEEAKSMDEWVGIWSASAVKSHIKSGVKSGVKAGVATAISTGVKSGVSTVIKAAREEQGESGLGETLPAGKKKPAAKKAAPKKPAKKK